MGSREQSDRGPVFPGGETEAKTDESFLQWQFRRGDVVPSVPYLSSSCPGLLVTLGSWRELDLSVSFLFPDVTLLKWAPWWIPKGQSENILSTVTSRGLFMSAHLECTRVLERTMAGCKCSRRDAG